MGTHYRGGAREVRALDAYIKLLRAAESVVTRVHRRTACDLTVSQFGVLESLHHLGPMHQRQIGTKLLKSGGNVTMVIDNLEKRGLVERRRDQKDRRFVSVHLTPAGERLIAEVFPRHVQSIVEELAPLAGDEQDALARLCRKLGRKDD
ncbi:MAG TPA: MarR family transcriptional regulator [bacterium]|jgi:MarR family 2-MHQ and catechol resistance regulon transcriptional repressor